MDLSCTSAARPCALLRGETAQNLQARHCHRVTLPSSLASFHGGARRFAWTHRSTRGRGCSEEKTQIHGRRSRNTQSPNVYCQQKDGAVASHGSRMSVGEGQSTVQKSHLEEYEDSDFDIYPYVSVGLAGKRDEILFEGVVKKVGSPQRGMRVVLRKMEGRRARRWGQRALEVAPRLGKLEKNRRLPFLTQLHGYIMSKGEEEGEEETLTLVHGYYGSYSLHRWLLHPDWLSELESRLGANEEALRRIGDERTGGPQVTRQLRVVRMVVRDVLTAVNFLHNRGIAHADLRLQNVHISAADRHVKVGVLGSAVDLMRAARPEDEEGAGVGAQRLGRREAVMAFDTKCVGIMMARMVLRELMEPKNFAVLESFMRAGHPSASLREYLRPMLCRESPYGSPGMQLLDRDGGIGWNLLAAMLAPKPSERITCANALRHPFLCGPRWRVSPSLAMVRWAVGSTTVRIVEEYLYLPSQRDKLSKLIGIMERMNPSPRIEDWDRWADGTWRLVYHSGKHVGLVDFTKAQSITRGPVVRIGNVVQTFVRSPAGDDGAPGGGSALAMTVHVDFDVMSRDEAWAHDKSGARGRLAVKSSDLGLAAGLRVPNRSLPKGGKKSSEADQQWEYKVKEEAGEEEDGVDVVSLRPDEIEISMELDYRGDGVSYAQKVIREVRIQIPREMFNVSELACCSYIDGRLMVLRTSTSKALVFVRSPAFSAKPPAFQR